jgi:protein SCO1/2
VLAGRSLLQPPAVELASGTLLQAPRAVADFSLTGSDGRPFTKAAFSGHWNLVFAGYTFCPDVCPTTLADVKAALGKLGPQAAKLQVTFVSIDPERDTPERLAQYVHYFDPSFRAATGTKENLDKLGQSLGYVYEKVPGATPQSYLMDHSAMLILVNPNAELVGYLTPPFKPDAIAGDLKRLLGTAG